MEYVMMLEKVHRIVLNVQVLYEIEVMRDIDDWNYSKEYHEVHKRLNKVHLSY
jgi:hypothetical protein